jgi:MerR family transcriptional regulator, light-induced transcriptional regulator
MGNPNFLFEDSPLSHHASDFLDMLLAGRRDTATRLILDLVERGTTVKDIYLDIFQVTQREVGRLWEINQVTVAQEHFCSAATQMIMAQLYPHIFNAEKIGRRMVATCVGSELHEIGVRMVTDFFEMEGWDTYYLGSNMPTSGIITSIEEQHVDLLGISATMYFHVGAVKELIAEVRASNAGQHIKILVGGYPFIATPSLAEKVGADGFGRDAVQAIALANHLVMQ